MPRYTPLSENSTETSSTCLAKHSSTIRSNFCVNRQCAYFDCNFWISSWSSRRCTRVSNCWRTSVESADAVLDMARLLTLHAQYGFHSCSVLAVRERLGDLLERIEADEPVEGQAPLAVILDQQRNER